MRRLGRQQALIQPHLNQLCFPSRITSVGNPFNHPATSTPWERPREALVGKTMQSFPWSKMPWSVQLQRTIKAQGYNGDRREEGPIQWVKLLLI